MADLKFAKIKEGWDVEQTLKFGLSYNTVDVVVRHMKIHANVSTWLYKSTPVREVWNLVHCQSNQIIMPKFWEEISWWILNKYFRLHHSKIEMKVYWLSQELNYQIKKYIIDSWKCAEKKMFWWKYSSSILLLFPSSFKIGIGLYFKPLTILTTVLSPQPFPLLSQSHGCLEYS